MQQFWPLTIDGLTIGAIYSLVALGYTLVYGVLRLINFAHSEIFMIGTFAALFATRWMNVSVVGGSTHGAVAVTLI
ncbi:MAG TPA: branched-chain amino acid ABC transporter permease, partial [Aeromicrobium sp.]|nr:branched-chain amino acid ABC transporter permease [Aeromicrobium sp.]